MHSLLLQARVAALLKEHPAAGQAFCRLLVSPYFNYIEGGKGEHLMGFGACLRGEALCHHISGAVPTVAVLQSAEGLHDLVGRFVTLVVHPRRMKAFQP
jgi:hypothetical protein